MCLNFLIVKIGCDNDNTVKIDTSVLIDVTNTVIQTNSNTSASDIATFNDITITNNGIERCGAGGFNVTQTNAVQSTTVNNVNITQSAQLNSQMVNKVENEITQKQTEGILAFLNSIGQAGSVTNSQDITDKIKEAVKNAVTQSIINEAWNGTNAGNTLVLVNNGIIEADGCTLVQSNYLNVRVTNLATAVQTTLAQDSFINNLVTYSKQSQDSAVLPWKWIILGIIILIVVIIIAVLMYFIFGSKGSTPQTDIGKEEIKAGLEKKIFAAKNPDLAGLEKSAEARTGRTGTGGAFSRLAERVRRYGGRAAEAEV